MNGREPAADETSGRPLLSNWAITAIVSLLSVASGFVVWGLADETPSPMKAGRPRAGQRQRHRTCLLAAALLLHSTTAQGMQDRPTFRSTAEIVRLQVAVFARDGGPVTDLDPSDFVVLQDGQERPLSVFFGPENGPLEVAIAMDASGSMMKWSSRDVFHTLLDELHPSSCVLLLPFRERVAQGIWGHPSDPQLRNTIDQIPQVGPSEAAYDSLIAAFTALRARSGASVTITSPLDFAQLMRFRSPAARITPSMPAQGSCVVTRPQQQGEEVRRAVVMVTDERDTASQARLEDVLLSAWGSGIPVFALAVGPMQPRATASVRTRQRLANANDAYVGPLQTLAKYTGGIVLRAIKGRFERHTGKYVQTQLRGQRTAIQGMERLGQALRGHYVLGFVPTTDPENATALIQESEIEVRVDRNDVEVLTVADLVTGQGKSEGAAMDVALRGFRELAEGETERALQRFGTAVSLGPALGLTHYGRALALAGLYRHEESLPAFEEARKHAPWLPDLNARVAHAQFEVGNFEVAWERALSAHYRGSEVAELIEKLQLVAARPVDLTKPPVNPRIAVQAETSGGLIAMLASPRLTAAVVNLAERSDVMQTGWALESSDLLLRIRITEASANGPWIAVQGQLVVEDPVGREWATTSFRIHDTQNLDEVADELEASFRTIEEAVRGIHQRPE